MPEPPESSGSTAGGTPGGDAASKQAKAPREAGPFEAERAWREGFDAFEQAIGRPLEAFMGSDEFADAAAQFFKANAKLQSELEQGSHAWREAWDLPGRQDVEELRSVLEDVRSELRALTERLAAVEAKLG